MDSINAGIAPKLFDYVVKTFLESPYYKLSGIYLEEAGPGYAKVSVNTSPELTNALGLIHGGVIMTLADSAMGNAIRASGATGVTVDFSISFISSPKIGDKIWARAETIKIGVHLIHTEAKVFSADKVIAYGKGTFYRTKTIELD